MITNDESTLTDKHSPGKRPVTPVRSLRAPTPGAQDPGLGERIGHLKQEIGLILKDTKWPSKSKTAANDLLNVVKSSPDISNHTTSISQELQCLFEQYIRSLEDVHTRLKDASSKSGMEKWELLDRIKSLASNRSSKCTLLFRTCQHDISKVVGSINEFLDNERKKEDLVASGISSGALTVPSAGRAATPSNVQEIALNDSTSGASPAQDTLLPGQEDEARGPISKEALTILRKTLKTVDSVSGSIPVAGNFVAAAAKVGLAFVDTIQAGRLTMDKNDDLAKDLASQTDKLSRLLEKITKAPNADEGQQIADDVNNLQRELQRVHDKVKEWRSLGRFDKGFHARDHGEALKGHQGTIQTAMEEMQLLVGIDTRSIVIELKSSEERKERRRLLDRLGDGKYGAQGNSIQDVTCCPGTRVEILRRMDNWIRDPSTPVLWLRGMAGRGKSTVASTVVENWKRRASCAIFHFRRGQTTLNTRLVCALARQLADSLVPEVGNAVLDIVQKNEDIADKRLEEQFETLFVASLAKLQDQPYPILIVVDALDECDIPKDAVDLIRLIDRHSPSLPANVKFLLTSRPEAHLLQAPEQKKWHAEDLDTAPDVSNDLERFIEQACQQIRHTNPTVPESWPSSEDLSRLVEMSQGLFQWARTVITYISSGSPMDRLRGLLRKSSMWSGLDDLYHQILSKAFDTLRLDPEREDILRRVLGVITVAPYPISLEVVAGLYSSNEIFDGTDQADILQFLRNDILADLNSLLFIPISSTEPIRLMHTSIRDLLVSERRCKQASYYINVIQHHQQLASTCLDTMNRDLKENICGLSDLSKSVSEIQDTAEHKVPTALLYCCRSWSIHLTEGVQWPIQGANAFSVRLADFEVFSKEKVMFWLEVMSLAGVVKDAIIVANKVCEWLQRCPNGVLESDSLATLWNDVQRFIAAFSEPIEFGPLHIYVSALAHCPAETELWKLYRKLAKVQTIKGLTASTWSSNIWVRSIGEPVNTVAFSPDGKVLASGSDDYTIRLWDTQTGTVIGEPLTGHGDWIWSVCFSPDGRFLASGSKDTTIRLWDTRTGTMIGEPLTGYSGEINSVCVSPNGKVLASGSGDNTIRLWDTATGIAIGEPLTGHGDWIWSVCFSPDGRFLASGSKDTTIRLWDTRTGTMIGEPLTGHSGEINSVCFSPQGKVLASGSHDETIRLWDPQTGTAIGEPLTGHGDLVRSICFSPNDKVLASGSDDHTIQLWDTETGTVIGEPLRGHSNTVYSACFSPDGRVLASGSWDHTIRLWDTQSGTGIAKPTAGHRSSIYSVCLSPDGKFLASGSDDQTIQFWDTQTGTAIGEPVTGHSSSVTSVCLSPDGNVLASGSWDGTIRLWDIQTRTAIGKSLTGHSNWVGSVCFSPDGKVLASGSYDNSIRLWDTESGTVIGEALTDHDDWVRSVCFSPDGKVLASGSDDKTIRLWDPQTGTAIGEPLTGHADYVYSVCFSPDGSLLGGHYRNGDCATWDAVTRQRCDTSRSLPLHWNPAFHDHWVVFSSSRFIWLPPQYWESDPDFDIVLLSGSTLAVLRDGNLSLFDVSLALKL